MSGRRLSADQRTRMLQDYANGGVTQRELADRYGVGLPCIQRWIKLARRGDVTDDLQLITALAAAREHNRHHKASRRPRARMNREQICVALHLREQGRSQASIAEVIGVTQPAVCNLFKRLDALRVVQQPAEVS